MQLKPPVLPEALCAIEDFMTAAGEAVLEERPLFGLMLYKQPCGGADFFKLELKACKAQNCQFSSAIFAKGSFVDIEFRDCDFSAADFTDCYFERCSFHACKCTGTNFTEALLRQVSFTGSNLGYATFHSSRLEFVSIVGCDLTEAAFAETTVKNFATKDSRWVGNHFIHTSLKGIDFTENTLSAPVTSWPPEELRGIKIDLYQAAELMPLLGIEVKL